jgi:ABC-type lipoprotein release transport system permease subunit
MNTHTKLLGVSAMDPLTYAGAMVMLLLVAFFATWIPARRAAAVEPMAALRCD